MKRILPIVVGAGLLLLAPVLFTAGFIQFILPESYLSVARIFVREPLTAVAGPVAKDPLWIATQIEIIQSKAVLDKVVERLSLAQQWGKKYKESGPLPAEMTYLILKSMVSVRQAPKTSLIEIRVMSEKPGEAAQIANTIAQVFRENRVESERARTQSTSAVSPPVVEIIDVAQPGLRPVRPTAFAKVGFFAGSVLSGLSGLVVLILGLRKPKPA